MEDELFKELEFSRFAPEKQEQIRQLVSYTTMMGLTGKDLVSIGGKLDRMRARQETESNRKILLSMGVRPIGKDPDMRERWAYQQGSSLYHFDQADWYSVRVRNVTKGRTKTCDIFERYNVGKFKIGNSHRLVQVMLNVAHGHIDLNF